MEILVKMPVASIPKVAHLAARRRAGIWSAKIPIGNEPVGYVMLASRYQNGNPKSI